MKVRCKAVMFGYDDLMTYNKEYEVMDIEKGTGDYWIEDDSGEYNPYPQILFEVVSK